MKFNRITISLAIFAVALTSIVYFLEIRPATNQAENENQIVVTESERIFPFAVKDIQQLTIEIPNQTLEFIKTDAQIHPWQMKQPQETQANDASISFLLNLFPQVTNNQEIPINQASLAEYGLETPQGEIFVTLDNGDEYKIQVGGSNFDNSQIYGLVKFPDSASQSEGIFLMSKSFQYAIERDLQDWQQSSDNEE